MVRLQHWCACNIGALATSVRLQHRCACNIGAQHRCGQRCNGVQRKSCNGTLQRCKGFDATVHIWFNATVQPDSMQRYCVAPLQGTVARYRCIESGCTVALNLMCTVARYRCIEPNAHRCKIPLQRTLLTVARYCCSERCSPNVAHRCKIPLHRMSRYRCIECFSTVARYRCIEC